MAFTYDATRDQIDASAAEEKMKLISEVLPASYDNALLDDYAALGPTRELGLDEGGRCTAPARRASPPPCSSRPPPPTATAAAST
jgi:electron transport complex protein RnfG